MLKNKQLLSLTKIETKRTTGLDFLLTEHQQTILFNSFVTTTKTIKIINLLTFSSPIEKNRKKKNSFKQFFFYPFSTKYTL